MYALLMQKVLTEANMGIYNEPVTVKLKQKQYGLAVGGCNYNWGNQPFGKGRRYGELDWKTRSRWRPVRFRLTRKREPNLCGAGMGLLRQIAMTWSEDFFDVLWRSSGCLDLDEINKLNTMILKLIRKQRSFSTFVPEIEKVLGEQSLLKNGTWAFLGDGRAGQSI